jgi:serine/threonine protein kinase
MSAGNDPKGGGANPSLPVRQSETAVPGLASDMSEIDDAPDHSRTLAGVPDFDAFALALVEIGVIDTAELATYPARSAEGVLGLARDLAKAGRLTQYQAAAIYQGKGRGLLIGDYLILDKLGQGGMGVVFKARHRRSLRVGALKILPPSFAHDKSTVLRFRREVEAARRLRHPNLVAAQDADEDRGVHFFVMDYVEGRDLDRIVRERGPMHVVQAIDYLIQAARGLDAAHAQGIIHRDIKPGNLMLDRSGTVRVLDLGLARIVDAANPFNKTAAGRLTQSGMYMGTVDYMAPEQAEDSHRVDQRADIYSLGCTLYYFLTGRGPFLGDTIMKRMLAHMQRPAPSLRAARPDVSPALESAYQKMMAKRPEDRPASMSEVITLLQASKVKEDDVTGRLEAPAKSPPELNVHNATLPTQAGFAQTETDSSIFGRRVEPEGSHFGHEPNLRDMVTDAPPDSALAAKPIACPKKGEGSFLGHDLNLSALAAEVRREATPHAAAKPPSADVRPLKRPALPPARGRPSSNQAAILPVGAGILVVVALVGIIVRFRQSAVIENKSPPPLSAPDLRKTAQNAKLAPPARPKAEGKLIFDGTSGRGWMLCKRAPLPPQNIQPDGLNPHRAGSYIVVYDQKLGDFVLEFDYKLAKGCNTGVFLRVSDLNNPVQTGIEVSLDDTTRGDDRDSGGFHGLVAPKIDAQKPAGQWNHMTITAWGSRITVTLNKREVSSINLDLWTLSGKRPDGSDHQFQNRAIAHMARVGYLGFQDLGSDCWFKNINLTSNPN